MWDRPYRRVLTGDLSTAEAGVEDPTELNRSFKVVLDICVQISESHPR